MGRIGRAVLCVSDVHPQILYKIDHTGGILSLCSLSALTLHAIADMPMMIAEKMAVFCRQLAGCAYHPPAGDHTSVRGVSVAVVGGFAAMVFLTFWVSGWRSGQH
jgi:hypothetical protein